MRFLFWEKKKQGTADREPRVMPRPQHLVHLQGGNPLRKSTKLAGLVAGAACLAGGFAIAPQAQASTTTPVNYWSCNGIHGTNPANTTLGGGAVFYDNDPASPTFGAPKSITFAPALIKVKIKVDKVAKTVQPPLTGYSNSAGKCSSGALGLGDVKSFGGSLAGKLSCSLPSGAYDTPAASTTEFAPTGSQSLGFTGIDPVTLKAFKATMSVALTKPGTDAIPQAEGLRVHGIVTKGVIPGSDIEGKLLQQPIATTAQSPTGTSPYWDDNGGPALPNGNTLTPDNATLNLAVACAVTHTASLPSVAFATDGNSIGGGAAMHATISANGQHVA